MKSKRKRPSIQALSQGLSKTWFHCRPLDNIVLKPNIGLAFSTMLSCIGTIHLIMQQAKWPLDEKLVTNLNCPAKVRSCIQRTSLETCRMPGFFVYIDQWILGEMFRREEKHKHYHNHNHKHKEAKRNPIQPSSHPNKQTNQTK